MNNLQQNYVKTKLKKSKNTHIFLYTLLFNSSNSCIDSYSPMLTPPIFRTNLPYNATTLGLNWTLSSVDFMGVTMADILYYIPY